MSRTFTRGGPPRKTRSSQKHRKLAPYMSQIDALLADNVWNAMVILREIQAQGYEGSYTVLREYVAPKRALRPSKATVRFETEPGEQLQHDWGELWTEIGGERVKVYIAVNALGFSRRFHVMAAPKADAEHTYESLIQAFEWFGGTTSRVLVDNQRSAVLEHRRDRVRFNPGFKLLAKHYGFRPVACRPYRAQTKGKVERMVGYVKHHFFVRYRSFASWAELNQRLATWLVEEADRRSHGTVKEVVAARFAREASHLVSLPAKRFETDYHETRKVAFDGYIDVRGNRYSVPIQLAGKVVAIRLSLNGKLRVFTDDALIATHPLKDPACGWGLCPDHHRRLWSDMRVQRRDLAIYEAVA
ncbi:MAG: IS21 family transposase [Verrucomicrobiota bacterium]